MASFEIIKLQLITDGNQENFLFGAILLKDQVFLKAPSGKGPLYDLEQQGRKLFMKDQ